MPVSPKTAFGTSSTSVVRSNMPRIWRYSGPQWKTMRPEGPKSRTSSCTMPTGTFQARKSTKGSAGPGWPVR